VGSSKKIKGLIQLDQPLSIAVFRPGATLWPLKD